MEFNRNHYFLAGLVVLLLGVQLRLVDSYVLNENVTRFLMERQPDSDLRTQMSQYLPAIGPTPHKTVHPPQWLGWALASIGSVLILHSLAMPKPT